MSLLLAAAIVVGANLLAALVMLGVRRRAPSGSFFKDTQQASGVFAVAGTTFAVIVAFTFLLAFQSYNDALSASEDEAVAVSALFHGSELFAPASRDALQGELICYGRAVVNAEWRTMRDQRTSPLVRSWIGAVEHSFQIVDVRGGKQSAAFQNWATVNQARQNGRRGRLAQAAPFVPPPVWFFLIAGGLLVIVFVGFFADSRERRSSQTLLIVTMTTMIVASLLLVRFLDNPYEGGPGSIQPSAMRETLRALRAEHGSREPGVPLPCDRRGRPLPGTRLPQPVTEA